MKKEKILVWLSWGVDSAVAAALLLEQGYEVSGGFMKNYISDKGNCTTYKDAEEAIKVANYLGIPLLSFDLQKEYQEKIIDYIFAGYEKGITPNPDVLCNSLIKFDVFLQKALELGFDAIATGHYARIQDFQLLRGIDYNKDQSYFLAGLNQFQLSKSLFPLGRYTKSQVRTLAKKYWLPNAERKDSQGLCFIGNIPIREFLLQRFPKKEGAIIYVSENDIAIQNTHKTSLSSSFWRKVGTHQGAYFYTIGQKHGLGLNFKAYVYRIDIANNILYVTDKDSEHLKTKTLIAKDWRWINSEYSSQIFFPDKRRCLKGGGVCGKIRYRQNPPAPCYLKTLPENVMQVIFEEAQRAVAPGQIFVAYQGEVCLGCGVIA